MNMITKPMKAETCTDAGIDNIVDWPKLCSFKLDGWRGLILPGQGICTQSFKPLRNKFVRTWLNEHMWDTNLDGELVTFDGNGNLKEYNDIQSDLSAAAGEPDFRFMVFDWFGNPVTEFGWRSMEANRQIMKGKERVGEVEACHLEFVRQKICSNAIEVREFYALALKSGYEGIIIRAPGAPYKSNRSTLKQEWMLKVKPWEDAEGIIIGFEELMHNTNEDTRSLHGTAKRSHSKLGMVPAGSLGKLIVATEQWGEVSIGGGKGLTHALRQKIWDNQEDYKGKQIVFRYMAYGMKDKPRFPGFKGFRND